MQIKNKKQLDKLSNQGNPFMVVSVGETLIRPMSEVYAVREHRIKIDGGWKMVACPTENARMLIAAGETQDTDIPPCPLCELGYPVSTSYLCAVVERERDEFNKKTGEKTKVGGDAFILKKGPKLMGAIQDLLDDADWGRTWDYDVKIKAEGQGLKRTYSVVGVPVEKSEKLTENEVKSFNDFKEKVDIEKMTTPRTYKEIDELIGGKETFPDYDSVKSQYEKGE
mgnify:FL=1